MGYYLLQFGIKSAVLNAELPQNSRLHILEVCHLKCNNFHSFRILIKIIKMCYQLLVYILILHWKSGTFVLNLLFLMSAIQCRPFWLFDSNGWQPIKGEGTSWWGEPCWEKKIEKACQEKDGLWIWSSERNWLQKRQHSMFMFSGDYCAFAILHCCYFSALFNLGELCHHWII